MYTRLIYCSKDSKAQIVAVKGGHGAHENLSSSGVNIGNDVKLLGSSNGRGPVELDYEGRNIFIGRELAAKIIVKCDTESIVTLDKVRIGDKVEVLKIKSNGDIRYRLLDMGLIKGVTLRVIRYAPLGDPIEVSLRGFNLSLRKSEAESIVVKIKDLGINKNQSWFSD